MGGGGTSGNQKSQAAWRQNWTGQTGMQNSQQQYEDMLRTQGQVTPFYQGRMNNGLPFYRNMTDYNSGNIAQAFAPARADIYRRTSQYTNLPSGYRDALINNLNAQQGRAFDSSLTQAMMANEMAKQQGAAGLMGQEQFAGNQGLQYAGLGAQANQSLLGAPQKPSVWGTVGGLGMQALKTLPAALAV